MKKLLLLSIFLLCTVLSLSACTRNYKLKHVYEDADVEKSITNFSHISDLDGTTYIKNADNLALFKNEDNCYIVYDIEKNKVIRTFDEYERVDILSLNGTPVILSYTKSITSLYSSNGKYIANALEIIDSITVHCDLFEFNNHIYRIEDDQSITLLNKSVFLPSISKITRKVDDFYYVINNNSITIYDQKLSLRYYAEAPSSTDSVDFFILQNGNVIMQVTSIMSEDAKKYTYFEKILSYEYKYKLTHYIINPTLKSKRNIRFDYVINSVSINGKDSEKSSAIKNIASITPIKDKKLFTSETKIVTLNNRGKISGYLYSNLKDLHFSSVTPLTNNYFAVKSEAGETYIVDIKGKILAVLGSAPNQYNQHAFIYNNIIYTWDLSFNYNLNTHNMSLVSIMPNSIILKKNSDYYIFDKNGSITPIFEVVIAEDSFYVVYKKNDNVGYVIYNDLEEVIISLNKMPSLVVKHNETYIIKTGSGNNCQYYISSK